MKRAAAFRDGGQYVDIRGTGRAVIGHIGLEDAIRAMGTGKKGIAFVDQRIRVRARIDQDSFGSNSPTDEMALQRSRMVPLASR
jgi:hypothetical protein